MIWEGADETLGFPFLQTMLRHMGLQFSNTHFWVSGKIKHKGSIWSFARVRVDLRLRQKGQEWVSTHTSTQKRCNHGSVCRFTCEIQRGTAWVGSAFYPGQSCNHPGEKEYSENEHFPSTGCGAGRTLSGPIASVNARHKQPGEWELCPLIKFRVPWAPAAC